MHTTANTQFQVGTQANFLLRLAKAWEQRGRRDHAIDLYRQAIEHNAVYAEAYFHLGKLLQATTRIDEAFDIFQLGVQVCPNDSSLHKALIDCVTQQSGLDKAYDVYKLERTDSKPVHIGPEGVLCCVVVRNEGIRLPYFLKYYRGLGVSKFFVVDNGSSDGSLPWLVQHPDVYVWTSSLSFNRANFGSSWFELILRKYGLGHWCLIVDADELFCYPQYESRDLRALCSSLEQEGKRAYNAVLLDMYSDKAVRDTDYVPGSDFIQTCPYFDRTFYHRRIPNGGPYKNQIVYMGGARQRVFGSSEFYLSKVPLQQYGHDVILAGGQHWTNLPPSVIATESGCLLHFKYFSTFADYANQEATRKEHSHQGKEYVVYSNAVANNPSLNLYSREESVRFLDSAQLVELGIMSSDTTPQLRVLPINRARPAQIRPADDSAPRPLLSVVITCYKRLEYIERAIQSVLTQVSSNTGITWELEIVQDGDDVRVRVELEDIVDRIGDKRIRLFTAGRRLGQPAIFNLCLNRSQGYWVHLLHDDDWVLPGFYEAITQAIAKTPTAGAVFCHHIEVDENGKERWVPPRESESSGLLSHWVERIGIACRPACAAMVVRRDVYERMGGYWSEVNSAWDWEMWKRIAAYYPIWYLPDSLVRVLSHYDRETHHLQESGSQVADALRCIEISHEEYPAVYTAKITRRAKEHLAAYALNHLARAQMQQGNYGAAFANLKRALRCSQSPLIKAHLIRLFLAEERS